MMEEESNYKIEFMAWKNPDQLRALIGGRQVDIVAIPTNVAANFYNHGIDINLLNVSLWSTLWIVSNDKNIKSFEDLKGMELIVPFKGDLPEIILKSVTPEPYYKIRYVPSSLSASQLLLAGKAECALISEPECSIAFYKSVHDRTDENKLLYRNIDLQKEWGRIFNTDPVIPLAGLALLENRIPPEIVNKFLTDYKKALEWCKEHPYDAGKIMNNYFKSFPAESVADSMGHTQYFSKSSYESKKSLEEFFNIILKVYPSKIGGKLPAEDFYWNINEQ